MISTIHRWTSLDILSIEYYLITIASTMLILPGYSTMCGHAVICLGRFAVDYGLVKSPSSPETRVDIQCPCGVVRAFVDYDGKKTGKVNLRLLWSLLVVFTSEPEQIRRSTRVLRKLQK